MMKTAFNRKTPFYTYYKLQILLEIPEYYVVSKKAEVIELLRLNNITA
jgi:hypothetical protein